VSAGEAEERRLRHAAARLLAEGHPREAEALLEAAQTTHPQAAWIHLLLGRAALATGRTDLARARAAELERLLPESWELHALRARVALASKDLAAAERELELIAEPHSERELLRGLLREAHGDIAGALGLYRAALERAALEDG
jgi:uncharacterized membrane-anchored protein